METANHLLISLPTLFNRKAAVIRTPEEPLIQSGELSDSDASVDTGGIPDSWSAEQHAQDPQGCIASPRRGGGSALLLEWDIRGRSLN